MAQVFSGKKVILDNVFSGEGVDAFDLDGNRVWVERAHAKEMFARGELVNSARVVSCQRCGAGIDEERSADFPGLGLCESCFGKFVEVACVTTPGQLIEGYGSAALATAPEKYVDEMTLDTSRRQRRAFFVRILAPKRSRGEDR